MGADGKARRDVWLPAGNDWYDMAHRKMLKGGTVQKLSYTIDQNAWFVKAGAILPLAQEGIQDLQTPTNEYRIYVAPGKGRSHYVHYEDDGESQAYPEQFAITRIEKNATGSACTVFVAAREGSFKGMSETRRISLILGGVNRCPKAMLSGSSLECTYNENTREACISLPEAAASQALKIQITY